MGGVGSGRRRRVHTGIVEEALALDMRALRRLGVVRTGECVHDTVRWSQRGLNTPPVRLRADVSDVDHATMTINGEIRGGVIRQCVVIDVVRSGFGGYRLYFLCPDSGRRCEVLYYRDGRFAGRTAQRLSYDVQGLNELSRARRRVAKLRERLRGSGTLPRPRGSHRYEMMKRLREAEFEAMAQYLDRLRGLI